jgi:hypothetical protein
LPLEGDINLTNLFRSSGSIERGALYFSSATWASSARAFASEIWMAACDLYRSSSLLAATASRLEAMTAPVVAAATNNATNAATPSEISIAPFHQSEERPNTSALSMIGLLVVAAWGAATIGIWILFAIAIYEIKRAKHSGEAGSTPDHEREP